MADCKDTSWAGLKYTPRQARFLRDCATLTGKDDSKIVETCIALALPQILANKFVFRTELDDIIDALWESVRRSLDAKEKQS